MDTGSKFDFEPNLLASTPLGSPFMMLRPQSESPFETQHQINMNQEEDEKEDKDDNEEGETVIVTDYMSCDSGMSAIKGAILFCDYCLSVCNILIVGAFRFRQSFSVLLSVGKKWKDCKCNLKALYFDENKELDEQLGSVPPNVDAEQWATLVSYWRSDLGKGCKTIECLSE
ncbi:hypothetical protein Ancab_006218 [Ancistrocladus abbreviatus]